MDRAQRNRNPITVARRRIARLLRSCHTPSLIVENLLPASPAIRGINRNPSGTKIVVRRLTWGLGRIRQMSRHGQLGGHHKHEPQTHHEQNAAAND
jgi:hypothetical protein